MNSCSSPLLLLSSWSCARPNVETARIHMFFSANHLFPEGLQCRQDSADHFCFGGMSRRFRRLFGARWMWHNHENDSDSRGLG